MAPQSRKRKSEAIEEAPQPQTPTGTPERKRMKITESQKQALMDNLQLEITERARKLRAHYALQCADMRSRIERRVNRIPVAMRNITMGELMDKHAAAPKPQQLHVTRVPSNTNKTLPPLPREEPSKSISPIRPNIQAPVGRGKKRKSSDIQIASDKENEQMAPESLPVAKKPRGRPAAPGRATSRTTKPANVLSPRSHNSRTLPRSPSKDHTSPMKPTSPAKSFIARPVSPLKPGSPLKSAASAATSAITAAAHGMMEHAKRGATNTAGKLSRTASREKAATSAATTATAANTKGKMLPPPRPAPSAPPSPQRTTSQSSNTTASSEMSSTSTSTTVITKAKRAVRAPTKTTVAKGSPVTAKKITAAATKPSATTAGGAPKTALKADAKGANKKVVVAEPAAGQRVLRKRT